MSQRRFDLVLKSQLVITPGIVQPPEAMGLQEDRVAELHPKPLCATIKQTTLDYLNNKKMKRNCIDFKTNG